MADFDPFENQGGQAAWDPEHATDPKKQAAELSRRIAADADESGNEPSTFAADADTDRDADDDTSSDGDTDC